MDDLTSIFSDDDRGVQRMRAILDDPEVSQILANRHDRIFYWAKGTLQKINDSLFAGPEQYSRWVNQVLALTDAGYVDVNDAATSVIEGSFQAALTPILGSIHVCTKEITRSEPIVTIRKQPTTVITLDDMFNQGAMSVDMKFFLQLAVHGRLNMVISGPSGAGKTTLARALARYIHPSSQVVTCEEIDELHIAKELPSVRSLTTYRSKDDMGRTIRETTLDMLVREALRMRADRIWVGETRGSEALALAKACNSGHDGSVTTVHADNGNQAVRQLVTYVMEGGIPDNAARDLVSRAFHLVIHVSRERMGRRVISEITELEPVLEGSQQRAITLWKYDTDLEAHRQIGHPSQRLIRSLSRYGVSLDELR